MKYGYEFKRSTKAIVTALMIFSFSGMESVGICQTEDIPRAETRKTREPVFRVSKLIRGKESRPEILSKARRRLVKNGAVDSSLPTTVVPNSEVAIMPETAAVTASIDATPVEVKPAPALEPKPVVSTRTPHPLDRAVNDARTALTEMRTDVRDYTAVLAKRELVDGSLSAPSYMAIKIRCPREDQNGKTPFSIYMKFLRPKNCAGREVIWVDGRNNNKLSVHEAGGIIGMRTFHLDPTSWIAMKGQKYPIYEAGLENLIVKLIEKAERDREAGPCIVNYKEDVKINKRPCSVIELIHNEKKQPYEFHKAKVYIDNEFNLPVRFAAYDWPETPGAKPKLLEEYTYYNVRINVGLTDVDFDPANPAYRFPN